MKVGESGRSVVRKRDLASGLSSRAKPSAPAGVVGVLVDGDRFLLIRRAQGIPAAGWWTPPSGRIEPGESPHQAVVREMREELGVAVEAVAHVWTCPSQDGAWTLHWWLCRAVDATITPNPGEVAEVRWCTLGDMRELTPTFPDDLRFFADVLPGVDLDSISETRKPREDTV